MRVVVDTNILISAELSTRGASRRLLNHLVTTHIVILSNVILDEFGRTLRTKFNYDSSTAFRVIDGFREIAELVEPVTFEQQICRDPDDDAILGTAVAGNADCIVTGDSDLLVLERFQGVDIVSPAEFERYEVESRS